MMHRRAMGGKRIRLDDPIPPEYENPQTPMTPADHDEISEHYSRMYMPSVSTPQHSGSDIYNESEYERDESYEQNDGDADDVSMHMPDYISPGTPIPQRVTRARARGLTQPPPPIPPFKLHAIKRAMEGDMALDAKKPGRKRRSVYGSGGMGRNDENSLYFIIMNTKCSLQSVVDDWIESYKNNRDDALLALMQFFINAAGCKGKITPEMRKWEHAAIIRKMTEEFDESSGEYPLISTGQQWKKFLTQFTEFVQVLVKQCQYSIIYDQYLMDNVISLLTGLSDSQVRAFRHTATLAAMKLMTALVDVALTVSVNTDNTIRQYEAERQKSQNKRAADRIESLLLKKTELDENMDEIKNMLTYMFKSVFVHRYRDTLPEIRAICMQEIGVWMRKFHTNFLDDSYLKYIGWTLHDRVGEVRLKCLQALIPLYESEELKSKLELFTSKFKDRIVSMTLDRTYDVAVQAVRLVISILKHHRDILTDKDCEHVYELVYSSHRAVAQAAGEFLNERLFTPDEDYSGIRTQRGKKRSPNTPLIRDLVQFFIESELHEHGAYLVDSLIDSNSMIKDWECMTDLLLEDPGPNEEALDNRQETSLIEIMVCAIKQSATGDPPVGRGNNRKVNSQKENKAIIDDKQKLTSHFIVALPLLLEKFSSDPEKLANLLYIPQHFDLELYTKSRQEIHLDSLLNKISKVVEKQEATEVLNTATKTLAVLCYEGHVNYTKCQTARDTMLESIVTKYREAIDEWNSLMQSNDDVPNDDEIFNIESSLKKMHIFYSSHDLGKWDQWDNLFKDVLDCAKNDVKLPERAMKHCLGATYFALQWELAHIEEIINGGGSPEREISTLRLRLNEYMLALKEIILNSNQPIYKEEAYSITCDLLIIFCERLGAQNQALSSISYTADPETLEILNNFVQEFVFVTDECSTPDEHSQIEELHKKRNFLAAYCKLIVYNMIPVYCAADVFKYYVKYYNQYGDIIKHSVGKTREISKTSCAITMVTSLVALFQQLQRESPGHKINRQSEDYLNIKELAKRFALSFGLDAIKNREAITALHRDGIKFAVNPLENIDDPTGPPPNILFLDIILDFTNKLLKQDKKLVLQFLDRKLGLGMPSSRGEDWQPLMSYRNALIQGEADQPPTTSRRAYRARKKDQDEDHMDDDD